MLTEYLSWRWCLYVNLAFAVPAALAALPLLHNQPATGRATLDIPGTLTASGGLFALVYGFSKAESDGWSAAITLGFLAAGVVLLAAFVAIQRRSAQPLLPLRVLADRNRAGAYLTVGITGAGMFGVFLFLTYYLQQTLGFSPDQDRPGLPADDVRDLARRGAWRRRACSRSSARARWSPPA